MTNQTPRWKLEGYSEEEFREILSDRSRWDELDFYADKTKMRWASRLGISIGTSGVQTEFSDIPKEQWEKWVWEDGFSMTDMAKSWGVPISTPRYYLNKYDIKLPDELWEVYYTKEELIALLSKGRPGFDEICKTVGVCSWTCYRWQKKYCEDV